MNLTLWVIYLIFGVIILAPLFHSDLYKVNPKYQGFKYVSYILLSWWLVDFLRLHAQNAMMIYYLSLLIFPIVMLFTIVLYQAISKAFNQPISRPLLIAFWIVFGLDLAFSLTNHFHRLLIDLPANSLITLEIFKAAPFGFLFYVHTITGYVILILIIVKVLRKLIGRLRKSFDYFPILLLSSAIVIGILLNLYHLFIETYPVDPSLLTVIIFISALYYIFYIRDLKLILGLNRNRFILNLLREKYLIVDEFGHIVDISPELLSMIDIKVESNELVDDLFDSIKQKAVLFKSSDEVTGDFKDDKLYLNFLEKPIYLPFFKKTGTFYLFFDQTASLKYINKMNYIKTHDLMTQLYNRNYLEELRDSMDDQGLNYHVILFDLDGLKLFNDYLGHDQGDDLLIRFANQLKLIIKDDKDSYPIRLGGDEFLILSIDKDDAYMASLINQLDKMNSQQSLIKRILYSYAVSRSSSDLNTLKKVLIEADQRLYQMKQAKSNYKSKLESLLKKTKSNEKR